VGEPVDFTGIEILRSRLSHKNMVRKIFDKGEINLALDGLQCYKHGDRLSLSIKFVWGHHVSKDFKIDKE
jgi:hypothetical protein